MCKGISMNVQVYLKALFGAATAGLGALQVATLDNHVTQNEWISVAIAAVGALAVVWAVPNAGTGASNSSTTINNSPTKTTYVDNM